MRRLLLAASAGLLLASATAAAADPIASGQTLSGVTVGGTHSVYHIFGHAGDPGGDYGPPDQPAVLTTFAAQAGNVFTFSATGLVSCCSDSPNIVPDGSDASGMNIVGANGLSGLSGNTHIPLVGVFTTDTDPFGGAAPASLSFDASNPLSLAPLLNQVFYIGDGRTGNHDASGTQLTFTAPDTATRLYLGVIDAFGFGGVTGYYNDNNGSFSVDIHLSAPGGNPVPEPATWSLMLAGFFGLGAAMRRRRAVIA